MKGKMKHFIGGVVLGICIAGGASALATSIHPVGEVDLKVSLNTPRYVLDGKEVLPSDRNGMYFNGVEYVPAGMIYKGTTYVPLRFLGESFGKEVNWDGSTRTITIDSPDTQDCLEPGGNGEGESSIPHQIINTPDHLPTEVREWVERSRNIELAQTMNTNEHTYILITRGEKPTAGYDIQLKQIQQTENGIEVEVTFGEPGDVAAEVITYPYLLIAIDRTDLPVQFKESNYQYLPTLVGIETLPPIVDGDDIVKLFEPKKENGQVLISGITRAFEATIQYELTDKGGNVIKHEVVQALAGTGTWGYFSETLTEDEYNQASVISFFTESAMDGERIDHVSLELEE